MKLKNTSLRLLLRLLFICSGALGCSENKNARQSSDYEGDDPGECNDGADNDRNGLFDCDDPGCKGSQVCVDSENSSGDSETVSDGDVDTDTDADTDSDTDADTDSDTDADTDSDTDADTDSDTDADTDSDSDSDTDTDSKLWVTGYYVGYQQDLYPPEDVQYDAMTHLVIGAILPVSNGSIETHFYIDNVNGPIMADDLITRAHAVGTKVIAMVGGDGSYDAFVSASNNTNRARFVNNLVTFSRDEHGFDGLDLDWEPLYSNDFPSFRSLVQDLRAAWPDAILTFPIFYLNPNYETADPFYAEIAPLLDQLNIMSYVMAGAYDGWQSWHSSALAGETASTPTSISSTVDLYLKSGVPASKLGIGIGFFGMCYSPPVTGPNQNLNGSSVIASDNQMSYTNIMQDFYSESAYKWDAAASCPYLSFSTAVNGCTFVSYDDSRSITEKAIYVEENKLGGTIVWTINQGYLPDAPAGQRDPLMDTLRSEFLKR